jgi:L-iditol 2-dehydrogenase
LKRATLVDTRKYRIDNLDEPHAAPGEVRIKVMYNGLCGSDLHIFENQHPTLKDAFPIVLGHEFSGLVDEIGQGVQGFMLGAPATIQPVRSCGKCKWCQDKKGNLALCPEERFYDGGTAQYYVAEAANVITFNNNNDLMDAAMAEPLAVAVHGVRLVPDGVKGKTVLVTGAGTIGLLTAQYAKHLGAAQVFVTDLMENRLDIVNTLGMIPINPLKDDFEAIIQKHTGTEKVEISFECAGHENSLDNCIQFTETRGVVVLLAVFTKRPAVDMFRIEDRELRVFGAYQYTPDDFAEAAKIIDNGVLDLEIMRGKVFNLDDVQEAVEWTIDHPDECLKVMLKIQ